jgi:hypothetical protein
MIQPRFDHWVQPDGCRHRASWIGVFTLAGSSSGSIDVRDGTTLKILPQSAAVVGAPEAEAQGGGRELGGWAHAGTGAPATSLSGRQAVIEKTKHRITVGADGIGHGAASDGAWAGDPSAALGRHTKRQRHPLIEPQAGVGPAGTQAAGHAEAGAAKTGAAKKGREYSPLSRRQLQPWRKDWPLHSQGLSAPPGAARTAAQGPLPWTQGNRFMTIKAYSRHKKTVKSSPQLAKGRQHGLVVVAGQGLGNACAG